MIRDWLNGTKWEEETSTIMALNDYWWLTTSYAIETDIEEWEGNIVRQI